MSCKAIKQQQQQYKKNIQILLFIYEKKNNFDILKDKKLKRDLAFKQTKKKPCKFQFLDRA